MVIFPGTLVDSSCPITIVHDLELVSDVATKVSNCGIPVQPAGSKEECDDSLLLSLTDHIVLWQ